MQSEYHGKSRFMRFGVAGQADILAFPRGWCSCGHGACKQRITPTWLEIKAEKGKQSELQRSFQQQVEREGHRYLIVRDLQELIDALE